MSRQQRLLRSAVADVEQQQTRAEDAEASLRAARAVCIAARDLVEAMPKGGPGVESAWRELGHAILRAEEQGGVFP